MNETIMENLFRKARIWWYTVQMARCAGIKIIIQISARSISERRRVHRNSSSVFLKEDALSCKQKNIRRRVNVLNLFYITPDFKCRFLLLFYYFLFLRVSYTVHYKKNNYVCKIKNTRKTLKCIYKNFIA